MLRSLRVHDLGRDVPYEEGMLRMRTCMRAVAQGELLPTLLFVEHAPVITTTRTGGTAWLRKEPQAIEASGVTVVQTDRGGDVTFHGPGQLVGYPVVQLERGDDGHLDLVGYLHQLEAGVMAACEALGVRDCRVIEGKTGVWVGDEKLVAIGVGVGHRGVTRHGFALNVDIDLERYTELIVPCGLEGLGVTSLARLLGEAPDPDEVRRVVADRVGHTLGFAEVVPSPSLLPPAANAAQNDGASHG